MHLSSASLLQKKIVKFREDCIDFIHSTTSHNFSGKVGDNCHDATINSDMGVSVVFGCQLMFHLSYVFIFTKHSLSATALDL